MYENIKKITRLELYKVKNYHLIFTIENIGINYKIRCQFALINIP